MAAEFERIDLQREKGLWLWHCESCGAVSRRDWDLQSDEGRERESFNNLLSDWFKHLTGSHGYEDNQS